LEIDRIAAFAVDDFVREGVGSFDAAMRLGFSHGWGELAPNRALVGWLRQYNEGRAPGERVSFHGFDGQSENTTAHSPRRYLEYVRDYLGVDVDIAGLAGDDERWEREEAVLDPAKSVGATEEAERLRVVGMELLAELNARAGDSRARACLSAGLGLLRYHKEAARPVEVSGELAFQDPRQIGRMARLMAVRDGLMAQNLLDIREIESPRGRTLVGSHNTHLQRNPSTLSVAGHSFDWMGAGAIVGALLGERYAFVASSLGRSEILGLGDPAPDTYEGLAQARVGEWGLVAAGLVDGGATRADADQAFGYNPLVPATVDGAEAIVHIGDAAAVNAKHAVV
jgi:erythromycin esterase-like protein